MVTTSMGLTATLKCRNSVQYTEKFYGSVNFSETLYDIYNFSYFLVCTNYESNSS